jgi:hypothetical protein
MEGSIQWLPLWIETRRKNNHLLIHFPQWITVKIKSRLSKEGVHQCFLILEIKRKWRKIQEDFERFSIKWFLPEQRKCSSMLHQKETLKVYHPNNIIWCKMEKEWMRKLGSELSYWVKKYSNNPKPVVKIVVGWDAIRIKNKAITWGWYHRCHRG